MGGPIIGLISVAYVRAVAWADAYKPVGWPRVWVPVVVLALLGPASISFPQVLRNGRDAGRLNAGPDFGDRPMELIGFAGAAVLPLLLAVTTATLVARTIEARSIYDARLSNTQLRDRQRARDRTMAELPTWPSR